MKVNTKVRYGLRTLIELALHSDKAGMFQREIAENQKLSEKYLDSIISSLKTSGLVINIGGKKSGYALKKPPSEITIYDIYRTFEPELSLAHCVNKPVTCFVSRICVANEFWMDLNSEITKYMMKTTLEDIVKKHNKIKQRLDKETKKINHCL